MRKPFRIGLLVFAAALLALASPQLFAAPTCPTAPCSTDLDCSVEGCGVCGGGGFCTDQLPGPLTCETQVSGSTVGFCVGEYAACARIAPGIGAGECSVGQAYDACDAYPDSECRIFCDTPPCFPSDAWDCIGNKRVSCSVFNNKKEACEARSPECTWDTGGGLCRSLLQSCSATNPCCSGQSLTCGMLSYCCYGAGVGTSNPAECCPGLSWDGTTQTCVAPLCGNFGDSCTGPGQGNCCNGLFCNPNSQTCQALCSTATACSTDDDCCPGLGLECGSANTCCKSIASTCNQDSDCCTGKCYGENCVLNKPPLVPASPFIAVDDLSNVSKTVGCTFNCPPTPLPTDPDGDNPVRMEYRWVMDAVPLGGWGAVSPLSCDPVACPAGSVVSLQSRACDSNAIPACSQIAASNQREIFWSGTSSPSGNLNLIYFVYAFLAALAILALAFMVSYAFHLPQLRAILQDELLQILSTVAVAFLLLSLNSGMDSFSSDALAATSYSGTPTTMIGAAQDVLGGLEGKASDALSELTQASSTLGTEASRGIFCNFLGVGFTLINCSPLNAFRGSITMSSFTTAIALADTFAQQFILSMAYNYAFTFIVPLGLFLRCFKTSRRAGGALVAVGFGFYTVYPTVIVASEAALHGTNPNSSPGMPSLNPSTCDPREADVGKSRDQFRNYAMELTDVGRTETFAYLILVRVVFLSILNFIITLGFIRELAHLLGSDIDVSSLARIT